MRGFRTLIDWTTLQDTPDFGSTEAALRAIRIKRRVAPGHRQQRADDDATGVGDDVSTGNGADPQPYDERWSPTNKSPQPHIARSLRAPLFRM
jgi:hypothetical protein